MTTQKGYGTILDLHSDRKPAAALALSIIKAIHSNNKNKERVLLNHIEKHLHRTKSNLNPREFIRRHLKKWVSKHDILPKGLQMGGNVKLPKALRNIVHTLDNFTKGNTKFKPHHLADGIEFVSKYVKEGTKGMKTPHGMLANKIAEGVSNISKQASRDLKKSGRGLELSGGALNLQTGSGQTAAGLNIAGRPQVHEHQTVCHKCKNDCKCQKGKGIHLSGRGLKYAGDQGGGKVKRKRKLSAYNLFLKTEIPKIKKANPKLSHREVFKQAVANYKKQKK